MSTSSSLVSLGSFQSGAKRYDVCNLGKAGAIQIGNLLFEFNDPNEEDVVECLRSAGMPPSAYPPIDISDPRFNIPNMIVIGNFKVFVTRHLSYPGPCVAVGFTIEETTKIQFQRPAAQQLATGGNGDLRQQESDAMLISNAPYADAIADTASTTTTITTTRTVKKIGANFAVYTQILISRLQMYFRRCIFKIRCNRRRMMLLLACMAQKQFVQQDKYEFNLAALMNDTQGGVLRDLILCAMSR
jgi:hypothetical protein